MAKKIVISPSECKMRLRVDPEEVKYPPAGSGRTRVAVSTQQHITMSALVICAVAFILVLVLGGVLIHARKPKVIEAGRNAGRTLVIIVPGTWGNGPDSRWPNSLAGQATFGSELQNASGSGSDVYPYVWSSDNSHSNRMEAARNLAATIDEKSPEYDRVCLVGHSHGGNIALAAAGMCRTHIDTVVCLATPFIYLMTSTDEGKSLPLPVYCTLTSRRNIQCIVTIGSSTDEVQDGWADLAAGVRENDAIHMTREWMDGTNHPRLEKDGFLDTLLGPGNIRAAWFLNVADENIMLQSFTNGFAGVYPHGAMHSRRMGTIVGGLLRSGLTSEQRKYLFTTVQPSHADEGAPVTQYDQDEWAKRNASAFELVGWRLSEISIELDAESIAVANNLDGSMPDPFIRILGPDGEVRYTSESHSDTMKAAWTTDYVLPCGERANLCVWAERLFSNNRLGTCVLSGDSVPQTAIAADHGAGRYWSARLSWAPVHF